MIKLKHIREQVVDVTTKLIDLGICDDQNFPSTTEDEVRLSSEHDYSIFLKNITYEDMYNDLVNNRVYNIKMIDGALIQMKYKFKDNKIEKHRLAFFPSPHLPIYQNNPNSYMEDNIYMDICEKGIVAVPLRFDFDDSIDDYGEKVAKPVIHPISHLTIGQYKNCRIPVTSALTPYQFIEFIIRNFYNKDFESFRKKLPKNNRSFNQSIHEEEKKILNISIPITN